MLSVALGSSEDTAPPRDWKALGIIDWLADRAEDLGYRIPTEVQRRAAAVLLDRKDCVIEAETGSGKTLAFVLPALSRLQYPPVLYPDDLSGPQAVIVVPTRELGVQVVMLIYKLFGGSVNPGIPGERANMFRYRGPKGLKVKGLLLPDEVEMAVNRQYLGGAHVVVGTPELLVQALERGVEAVQHAEIVVVDEVDACVAAHSQEMEFIMKAAVNAIFMSSSSSGGNTSSSSASSERKGRTQVVLVGATVEESLIEKAVQSSWVSDPISILVGQRMRVPRGLAHRYIVVAEPSAKGGAMCRQIRNDLKSGNQDSPPARVMVFADSEAQAKALAEPLRTVLWGEHALSVLLPASGNEPIKALHSFRDNITTLLLATPAAARGLDMPAVSHVYNLSPPSDAAEYLHRAGRAGRIGSPLVVRGVVTTMVTRGGEVEALLEIGKKLGIELVEEEGAASVVAGWVEEGEEGEVGDVDEAKRALEAILAFSSSSGNTTKEEEEDGWGGDKTEEEEEED